MMDGSGALNLLGIQPLPIGTLDEIRKCGLDPRQVACCHPEAPGVIRGCPVEKECRFHLIRYGSFKGSGGPKYVGYYLRTHEGHQKEDFILCHAFVRVLQARMDAGLAEAQKGHAHEIIRVIAQEGEKIVTRVGVPVNEADRSPTAPWKYVQKAVEVPRFPRPGENERLTYDQELAARELDRRKAEEQADTASYAAARASMSDQEEAFNPPAERERAEDLIPSGPQPRPLAEPIRRKA